MNGCSCGHSGRDVTGSRFVKLGTQFLIKCLDASTRTCAQNFKAMLQLSNALRFVAFDVTQGQVKAIISWRVEQCASRISAVAVSQAIAIIYIQGELRPLWAGTVHFWQRLLCNILLHVAKKNQGTFEHQQMTAAIVRRVWSLFFSVSFHAPTN